MTVTVAQQIWERKCGDDGDCKNWDDQGDTPQQYSRTAVSLARQRARQARHPISWMTAR